TRQVAQDLVVCAVLLDDVNDMLDLLAQESHRRAPALALGVGPEVVVLGDLPGQVGQLRTRGDGQRGEARLLRLQDVLVRPRASEAVTRVGARDRLGVDDEESLSVRADADGSRVPGRRNQTSYLALAVSMTEFDDGDGVGAAVGHIEGRPVG